MSGSAASGGSGSSRNPNHGALAPGKSGRVSFLSIVGELLVTAAVLVGLFIVWDLVGTNITAEGQQKQAAADFVRNVNVPGGTPAPIDAGPPPVTASPAAGEVFGVAYIPRFGELYARPLVEGTEPDQLDTLGLGHYRNTTMPGATGNFALAGHRQTHGAVLDNIDTLIPGDRIYIQTREGYYTYSFSRSTIVTPDRTDVLLPVPEQPGAEPTRNVLTLTSCNPKYGDWERFIAYAEFEAWRPLAAGPPSEIASVVAKVQGTN